jgi:hypothetical protein
MSNIDYKRPLTKKQNELQREVVYLIEHLKLEPNVNAVDPDLRTTHLELAKRTLITATVLKKYLLIDEFLNDEICRQFFPHRSYPLLWRTKRFQDFNYRILERIYLVQKIEYVRTFIKLPKKIYKDILAVNDLRNALSHSFFPENRRVKPTWKGIDIFISDGYQLFWDDMQNAMDFFVVRMHRRSERKVRARQTPSQRTPKTE